MVKKRHPVLKRDYWESPSEAPSPDGNPVFTVAEIALLKKHKGTLPPDLLNQLFDTKAVFGGTLEDVSQRLAEFAAKKSDQLPLVFEGKVEYKPATERFKTCQDIIASLRRGKRVAE